MKRVKLMVFLTVLLLVACGSKNIVEEANDTNLTTHESDDEIEKIRSGEKIEDIQSEEIIVETLMGIENIERLDQFVQSVKNGSKDMVRLIRHTIEGDPIYHDLQYDGQKLKFILDTTEDQYGVGNIYTYECDSIDKTETNTETAYTLQGCPQREGDHFFTILHDVSMQDLFEFQLRWGNEDMNEIDIKNQSITIHHGNNLATNVSDFSFSKETMNQIFKQMIFANFLSEKNLTNSCHKQTDEKYELTVLINSGEKVYSWSECDQSEDGQQMTKLVKEILTIFENSSIYQEIKQ